MRIVYICKKGDLGNAVPKALALGIGEVCEGIPPAYAPLGLTEPAVVIESANQPGKIVQVLKGASINAIAISLVQDLPLPPEKPSLGYLDQLEHLNPKLALATREYMDTKLADCVDGRGVEIRGILEALEARLKALEGLK